MIPAATRVKSTTTTRQGRTPTQPNEAAAMLSGAWLTVKGVRYYCERQVGARNATAPNLSRSSPDRARPLVVHPSGRDHPAELFWVPRVTSTSGRTRSDLRF